MVLILLTLRICVILKLWTPHLVTNVSCKYVPCHLIEMPNVIENWLITLLDVLISSKYTANIFYLTVLIFGFLSDCIDGKQRTRLLIFLNCCLESSGMKKILNLKLDCDVYSIRWKHQEFPCLCEYRHLELERWFWEADITVWR